MSLGVGWLGVCGEEQEWGGSGVGEVGRHSLHKSLPDKGSLDKLNGKKLSTKSQTKAHWHEDLPYYYKQKVLAYINWLHLLI